MRPMSDFETRVRDALTQGAEGAPMPVGLADGARARLRRRRRTTAGVVAAAFLVAAVPTGIAVVALQGDGGSDVSGQPEIAPGGMQAYSYGDATVLVPETWRKDGRYIAGDWCNGAHRPTEGPVGYVGRFTVRTEMACEGDEPLSNYEPFASFSTQSQGPAHTERAGWVTENMFVGSVWLTLRTDDPALAQQIKNSAEVIDDADPNGCSPRHAALTDNVVRPEPVLDLQNATVDTVTACQYGSLLSGNDGPTLLASDVYGDDDAQALVDLVVAQPEIAPTEENCPVSAAGVWVLHVWSGDQVQDVLVRTDLCHGLGSDDGTTYRAPSDELNAWLELGARLPQPPPGPDTIVSDDGGVVTPEQEPSTGSAPNSGSADGEAQ